MHALPAAGAGPDHRRQRRADPVPVRAAGLEPGRRSTHWAAKLVAQLPGRRSCATSPPTCRTRGSRPIVDIDRDTAARLGVTPATVDDALYDAFGQRIISTIFTQSNQYRVILEADPATSADAAGPGQALLPPAGGAPTPLGVDRHRADQLAPLQVNHVAQFPAANIVLRHRAGRLAGRRGAARSRRPRRPSACRPTSPPPSWAPPTPSRRRSATSCG